MNSHFLFPFDVFHLPLTKARRDITIHMLFRVLCYIYQQKQCNDRRIEKRNDFFGVQRKKNSQKNIYLASTHHKIKLK
jgi:hypothetical protein